MGKAKGNPNLGKIGVHFTKETALENQRKSAISRKRNKSLRDALNAKLDEPGESGESRRDEAAEELAKQMANGKIVAIELGAKILGEMQTKHELTGPNGSDLFTKKSDEELDAEIARLSKD